MSGEDAHLFTAERRDRRRRRRAGRPRPGRRRRAVSPDVVTDLLDAGRIPVVSTVAPDVDGQVYNLNADTAAAALAVALGAEKLVVLTDVEGLYADWPDPTRGHRRDRRRRRAGRRCCRAWPAAWCRRWRPACARCAAACRAAHVVDGRVAALVLLEVFTDEGFGTMVPDAVSSASGS